MPTASSSDARKVDQLIRRAADAATIDESHGALRQLFVEQLDFDPAS